MRKLFSSKYSFIGLFILALVLRFALNIYQGNALDPYCDDDQYFNLGLNLATKGFYSFDGLSWSAVRSPLFPLILAFFFKVIGPNFILPRIILSFADVFIGIMIFLLTVKLFKNNIAGFCAMVFWWFNPLGLYYNLFYNVDILLVFLLLVFLYLVLNTKYVQAVIFLALAALTKSIALYLIVPYLIYLFIQKEKIKNLFFLGLIFILLIAPWGIYNKIVFDRWNFGDSGAGKVMWGAHNEITFSNWREAGTWQPLPALKGYTTYEKISGEYPRDDYAMQMAKTSINKNLILLPRLFVNKFFYYWNFWPGLGESFSLLNLLVGIISYGWLLPLFILGLLKYVRKKELMFIWIYLLYFQLMAFLTYGSIRLRMPLTPLVFIVSFVYLFDKFKFHKS